MIIMKFILLVTQSCPTLRPRAILQSLCAGGGRRVWIDRLIFWHKTVPYAQGNSTQNGSLKNGEKITPISLRTTALRSFKILNPIKAITGKAIETLRVTNTSFH